MQHDEAGTVSRSWKVVILNTVQVIGWENIELISDRPLETMLDEFKRLKQEFPDRQAFLMQKRRIRGIMACLPEREIMSFSTRTNYLINSCAGGSWISGAWEKDPMPLRSSL